MDLLTDSLAETVVRQTPTDESSFADRLFDEGRSCEEVAAAIHAEPVSNPTPKPAPEGPLIEGDQAKAKRLEARGAAPEQAQRAVRNHRAAITAQQQRTEVAQKHVFRRVDGASRRGPACLSRFPLRSAQRVGRSRERRCGSTRTSGSRRSRSSSSSSSGDSGSSGEPEPPRRPLRDLIVPASGALA